MQIFDQYSDILQRIEQKGYPSRVLGHTPDGSPLVCLRTGGEKTPAIFISAGSHSTEQAGVGAAMGLLDTLDTEHQVYIIPTRDPMGMNGYAYALSLSLGEEPELNSIEDVEKILRTHGELLYEEDEIVVAIIGEYGYSTEGIFGKFETGVDFLKPLFGRRIFFPSRAEGIEGTALCQRAYTLIVSPEGEILHINRFHDTAWSPVEPRCTRNLMAEIQPGLTLDLHEYGEDGFWFSARHQRNENDEMWEKRMADAIIRAVADSGAKLAPEGYSPGSFFEIGERGVFWLIAQERGEGLNLADYGAHQYGPSFTIETGMTMQGGYQERVQTSMLAAQTAISVFEERWC
ncbi:MAG: M14 family metallocarboxypeptidase [Gemmatimonadetes bacterium]|nr:M14 family metallocarboxypeptidase [Gemmatimonadota bacterium]MYF16553.1 M14 family metallocarboxypeptidase [Gemmatimonadota bacterium]